MPFTRRPRTWRLLSLRWTNEHITGRKSLMTATLAIIAGKTPFYVSHQDIICHFQFTKNSTQVFFSLSSREWMRRRQGHVLFCSQKWGANFTLTPLSFFYQTLIFCFPTLLLQSCWAKYNIIKMDAALPFSKFKK